MFLTAFIVASLLTVPIFGGRLGRLSQLRLRHAWIIVVALAIQVVIVNVIPGGNPEVHHVLHLVSYGLAAAFLIANRQVAGMSMIALGAVANFSAIVANNGIMPASASALRAAGETPSAGTFLNSAYVAHPRLSILGDIFAIPKWWPLHNVFSIGDICIAIGAGVAIHVLCSSRLSRRGRAAPDQPAAGDPAISPESPVDVPA